MPDREKVMEALEHCSDRTQKRCNPTCPYHERNFCETELASDALAMLKNQETVRCQDCKHWDKLVLNRDGDGVCRADNTILVTHPDWYCADGVAKDIYVPDKEGR